MPVCGLYQYWDSRLNCCQCNSGYVMILGQCQIINTCDQYSYWNGNQCVCQSGYVLNPITQKCTQ